MKDIDFRGYLAAEFETDVFNRRTRILFEFEKKKLLAFQQEFKLANLICPNRISAEVGRRIIINNYRI